MVILFNNYMITRRIELRRMRETIISTSIQTELIRLQSFIDPLTEVYNRRALDDMADRFMARARRLEEPLTFMGIDADNFKEVNTRFGHLTGDFVLAEIAARLRRCGVLRRGRIPRHSGRCASGGREGSRQPRREGGRGLESRGTPGGFQPGPLCRPCPVVPGPDSRPSADCGRPGDVCSQGNTKRCFALRTAFPS